MALTGSMRDFGISEILQLIGHQKKSGTLRVQDKNRKVEILFDQGDIVSVKHSPLEESFDPGATLVRAEKISPEQLEQTRKQSAESLKPVEQILLNLGAVPLPDLTAAVTLSRMEALYSLFLWKDGDYSFEAGPVTYHQQWTQPISSEQVLMDGYRIKDEWPQIEKVIPDPRVQLRRKHIPAGTELAGEMKKVLRLVDDGVTAEDVAFRSQMGKFETFRVIKELHEQGMIEILAPPERPPEIDRRFRYVQIAALIILALGLPALLLGIFRNSQRFFRSDPADPAAPRLAVLALYHQDRVINAIAFHYAVFGSYPRTLEELVEKKELRKKDLLTPLGKMEYELLDPAAGYCRLRVLPENQRPAPPPSP